MYFFLFLSSYRILYPPIVLFNHLFGCLRFHYFDSLQVSLERLKHKDEKSTHLGYTVLWGELEHLKIETRLINERCTSELGECVIRDVKGTTSIFKVIHSDATLVFPMLDLSCDVEMFI
jgi:hypothetical protein